MSMNGCTEEDKRSRARRRGVEIRKIRAAFRGGHTQWRAVESTARGSKKGQQGAAARDVDRGCECIRPLGGRRVNCSFLVVSKGQF